MRLVCCLLPLLLLLAACGSGEKPEVVEVPAGDPVPLDNDASDDDATDDDVADDDAPAQGCDQTPPPVPLPVRAIHPHIAPRPPQATPQQSGVPTALLLLLPMSLGWLMRRPR